MILYKSSMEVENKNNEENASRSSDEKLQETGAAIKNLLSV